MAEISRLKLEHPALSDTGGASLHTTQTTLYTKVGDNTNARFFETTIANSATGVIDHNFFVDFAELTIILHLQGAGSKELGTKITSSSTPPITDFAITATGGDPKKTIDIVNNSGSDRNLVVVVIHNGGGTAGGGGGGSLTWRAITGVAPVADEQFGEIVYIFEKDTVNQLSADIKVPDTYVSGTQIKMGLGVYIGDIANDFKMQTVPTMG